MDEKRLQEALEGLPFSKIAYFDQVGSTNDVVGEWANGGAEGMCLAVANEQTKGRGRAGRSWHTPPGSALAFSVLVPGMPVREVEDLGLASGLGALAVAEAVEALLGAKTEIKWPNDVLVRGKKFCGVLAEAHWSGARLQALILGIGINIARNSVPPEADLTFPATSLEAAIGEPVDRLAVLSATLERLVGWIERLETPDFIAAWERRLAFRGQAVQLQGVEEQAIEGRILGLGPKGKLRLDIGGGETQSFRVGEIGPLRVRPTESN
ncbi:MAG: biotin--[acetyl-CoA-carboxylase] ligase [Chloroflexi bacterium]|nr:biotin--[acetyl-CoA-carboxylase] ligase [Chloroflexota bacterium]MQC26195.1 biotin--[acetyl-CoA-carboxylase] ligase [Chloroflexota bacterium]